MSHHAVSIKLTDDQFEVLKNFAHADYRTTQNTLAMLISVGLNWHLEDSGLYVKKINKHRDPDGSEYQYYSDRELKDIFESLPFIQ